MSSTSWSQRPWNADGSSTDKIHSLQHDNPVPNPLLQISSKPHLIPEQSHYKSHACPWSLPTLHWLQKTEFTAPTVFCFLKTQSVTWCLGTLGGWYWVLDPPPSDCEVRGRDLSWFQASQTLPPLIMVSSDVPPTQCPGIPDSKMDPTWGDDLDSSSWLFFQKLLLIIALASAFPWGEWWMQQHLPWDLQERPLLVLAFRPSSEDSSLKEKKRKVPWSRGGGSSHLKNKKLAIAAVGIGETAIQGLWLLFSKLSNCYSYQSIVV